MLTREHCAFFCLMSQPATRKNVHRCVSESERVSVCVCKWEGEKDEKQIASLVDNIVLVTAPHLTFSTEVLSTFAFMRWEMKVCDTQPSNFNRPFFFAWLPFEIVNISGFFLSILNFQFLFAFPSSPVGWVMRADFYSHPNNVESMLFLW